MEFKNGDSGKKSVIHDILLHSAVFEKDGQMMQYKDCKKCVKLLE